MQKLTDLSLNELAFRFAHATFHRLGTEEGEVKRILQEIQRREGNSSDRRVHDAFSLEVRNVAMTLGELDDVINTSETRDIIPWIFRDELSGTELRAVEQIWLTGTVHEEDSFENAFDHFATGFQRSFTNLAEVFVEHPVLAGAAIVVGIVACSLLSAPTLIVGAVVLVVGALTLATYHAIQAVNARTTEEAMQHWEGCGEGSGNAAIVGLSMGASRGLQASTETTWIFETGINASESPSLPAMGSETNLAFQSYIETIHSSLSNNRWEEALRLFCRLIDIPDLQWTYHDMVKLVKILTEHLTRIRPLISRLSPVEKMEFSQHLHSVLGVISEIIDQMPIQQNSLRVGLESCGGLLASLYQNELSLPIQLSTRIIQGSGALLPWPHFFWNLIGR